MKTAIVSGASGGIGSAIVSRLVLDGYVVYALYNKNKTAVDQLLSKTKGGVYPVSLDLTDEKAINDGISAIIKKAGKIDLLVNCAGIGLYKLATQTTKSEWDNLFNVNVGGMHLLTSKVLDNMISLKQGVIVNISSIWGSVGASMEVGYSATKSAIIGYTKALAKEVAPSGIRVNCVCPGVIDTPMNSRFNDEEITELIDQTPLGRIGRPEDVASAVSFLSSDASSFITGVVLTVDGGFTL